MKIYIEGSPLFVQRTGVGQYTKRLIDAIIAIDHADRFTIFGFLLAGKRRPQGLLDAAPNLSFKYVRFLPGKVYRALFQYRIAPPVDLLLRARPDLVIFPNFVRWPLLFAKRSIVIVYDLSFALHAEHSASRLKRYLSRFVPLSLAKSDHIITISENSKREIIDYYHVDPQKITIISPAVDHAVFRPQPANEVKAIKTKYQLSERYLLYTGTIEPRKNIIGILDAYAQLPASLRRAYQLVLVGGKGWLDDAIHRRLGELADLNIKLTGYAPDEDLPALYSGATLFIYPSFYEGFGMPPLEAMACGAPVVASNNSSLPEVVGKAGILVDAHRTEELTTAVRQALTSPKRLAQMRDAGLKQAAAFDWARSAKELHRLIREVGAR